MTVEELRNELIEITKTKTEPYSLGDICRMYANLIQTGLDSERSLSILKAGLYHEYM